MLEKYAENFSAESRQAGELLLAGGKLQARYGSVELFRAEVLDVRLHECSWRVEKNRLIPACDCTEFKAGQLCSHLWAALHLAQTQEALGKALQKNISRKISTGVFSDKTGEQESFYEYERTRSSRRGAARQEDSGPVSGAPARKVFPNAGMISRLSDGSSPDILYVINLDRLLSDRVLFGFETWWKSSNAEGKVSCRPFFPEAGTQVSQQIDEVILQNLLQCKENSESSPNYFPVSERILDEILALLAGTERLRWYRSEEKPLRFHRLNYAEGNKLFLQYILNASGEGHYRLQALLCTPEGRIAFPELLFLNANGIALSRDRLFRVNMSVAPVLALQLWNDARQNPSGLLLTAQNAAELSRDFYLKGWQNALEQAAELACKITLGSPRGVLFIQTAEFKFAGKEQLHAELSFEYAGKRCDPENPQQGLPGSQRNEILERDFTAEAALKLRLESLGFCREGKTSTAWRLLPSRLDPAIRSLVLEDWFISAAGKTYRKPVEKTACIQKTGMDWFEIRGEVDFCGQKMPLPVLLQALRRGAQSVRLDDGTYGILPLEWLEKFTVLTEIGEEAGARIR
ncbi:MAG: hypothetical protein WCT05_06800, partial [Lentisphaeria bacterium]